MPIHDWTRVDTGMFHAFHHGWIGELARSLNRGVLPPEYYALPEQHAAGFGPDVLTLQGSGWEEADSGETATSSAVLTLPKLAPREAVAGEEYTAPADKPLTLAAYETGNTLRAYVVHAAVGDALAECRCFSRHSRA